MSPEIEYDNGTPIAITWRKGEDPIAFLTAEHEERFEIDDRRILTFDGESTAPIVPRAPFVGMGCTVYSYSDRDAATVIEVHPSGKRVTVQLDRATRTDSNGMSECQSYTYERDPEGERIVFTRRASGQWTTARGTKDLGLGMRRTYHDYSY